MDTKSHPLSNSLTESVLAKLGLSDRPSLNLDGLTSVYYQWCRRVPFDNVRKLIHIQTGNAAALPGDSPTDFFEHWLAHGAGGTCWAGNGALQALLVSLGFDASRGVATMLVADDLPPNHGTVQTCIDGDTYLVDASILHSQPLLLRHEEEQVIDHPAWGVRTSRTDGKWIVRWKHATRPDGINCRIEYVPATAQDFSERHEHTRAWSPFNYELSVRSIKHDSMIGLSAGQQFAFDSTNNFTARQQDHKGRLAFLINEIGMSEELVSQLSPDRPTPPPPGSNTAAQAQARIAH
jgi:N-hydroxyarylamine O-acetyltransferase